jgi:outer membrane protein assembly factor BamB
MWPRFDRLARFRHDAAARTLVVESKGKEVASGAGGMMSLSANGDEDGLLWVSTADSQEGHASSRIVAFDAVTLEEKWRAPAGGYAKFVCPTVSGGHVFVASWNADGTSDVIDYAVATCD